MPYTAILFDLDGTLLDTLEDLRHSINRVLADRGLPTHELDAYRYFAGDGIVMFVKRAMPEARRDDDTVRDCVAAFRDDYARNWNVKTRLYDGVADMLDALTERGLRPAVLSNKPDEFTKLCVAELLPNWTFGMVLGQRDGVPRKPDPTGALEIAERFNVPPADFLYLGDSGTDMQTAAAAGMFPVGALWGFRAADELREHGARALIEHPTDILNLLD